MGDRKEAGGTRSNRAKTSRDPILGNGETDQMGDEDGTRRDAGWGWGGGSENKAEIGDGLSWGPQIWGMRTREDRVGALGQTPERGRWCEEAGASSQNQDPCLGCLRGGTYLVGQPTPMPSAGGSSAWAKERPLWVLRCCGPSQAPDLCAYGRIRGVLARVGGQGVGPAQSRRGGAREDGQAGRLGCSPSRLERRQRWRRRDTGGGGAETEPGGQEMRKDGDTVEGTKKWGESDDEGRGGRMRDRGPWFPLR